MKALILCALLLTGALVLVPDAAADTCAAADPTVEYVVCGIAYTCASVDPKHAKEEVAQCASVVGA